MNKHFKRCSIVIALASLVACAGPQTSGSQPVYASQPIYNTNPAPAGNSGYAYNPNQGGNNVLFGTVTRVDNLGTRKETGAGAVIGGVVGAIAGNQIGRTVNDAKTTGTVVGAAGGAALGHAIERNQNKNNTVLRVYVRLDNGTERYWDVTQAQIQPTVNQRVRIENDQLFAM